MTYVAAPDRYDAMPYRRCGRSGLQLPARLARPLAQLRPRPPARRPARDRPPRVRPRHHALRPRQQLRPAARLGGGELRPHARAPTSRRYRDELIISTKAGYDMWPGPYGEWGSRKYLLASLDQSLARMGLDYVDIFYSHRFDPDTPLEETLGALDSAVRQGKALYAGISSYSAERTREAAAILRELGTPLLIHQPSYSLLNRWIEPELLDVLGEEGIGCDRLLAARPGDADRQVPRRRARGLARGARTASSSATSSPRRTSRACARSNEIAAAPRPVARADGDRLDAARPARHLRADRRVERRAARAERRRARAARASPTTSWPRSTATRSTAGINLWAESSDA